MSDRIRFGDFDVECQSRSELVSRALSDFARRPDTPVVVFAVNGHALSLAKTDSEFRDSLDAADIVHADGGFLVTLSRFGLGPSIPERSSTTDLIFDLSEACQANDKTFYLLGGTEDVNQRCRDRLVELYPKLRIVGRRNGYFQSSEEEQIVEDINRVQPDVLWVGLGKPKEQIFCARWKHHLNARWIVTCGGCYNFVTGDYIRAPQWMQRANLEWLHRMIKHPKKLFWRYMITNPHALWIALLDCSSRARFAPGQFGSSYLTKRGRRGR